MSEVPLYKDISPKDNSPGVSAVPSKLTVLLGLGVLVFKAHRLLYHSTLGVRVIKKKKDGCAPG